MSGCLPEQLVLRSLSSIRSSPTESTLAAASAAPTDEAASQLSEPEDNLVQYVVLRRDLWTELGWPLGSIVAQACHASTAALWDSRNEPNTSVYCAPEAIDHMHKVVLEIKSEAQLRNLAGKLEGAGVGHKLWIEQPEDFATCLATHPARKSEVQQYFKKLKLCKGHIKPHRHEEPQPFLIEAEEVEEIDADFDPDFLRRMFDRIIWSTLVTAAASMGVTNLPETATKEMLEDDNFLQKFHHALLEVGLKEGALVCPLDGRRFIVKDRVPNLLLDEHEV